MKSTLPFLNNYRSFRNCMWRMCLFFGAVTFLHANEDDNNTVFIVSGGDYNYPFYNLTFESNGSVVDFQTYPLTKGNTYTFKASNISASHPFKIGASDQTSSPHVAGGQLDQNSQANNQEITVSIPLDFDSTLAYFCTIHSNMVQQFVISEPLLPTIDFIPVYNFNSSAINDLTTMTVSFDQHLSIVEELNSNNTSEIRFFPMEESSGEWVRLSDNQFYNANSTITSLQDVDDYLVAQNIHPVNALNSDSGDDTVIAPQTYNVYEISHTAF